MNSCVAFHGVVWLLLTRCWAGSRNEGMWQLLAAYYKLETGRNPTEHKRSGCEIS